MAAFTKDRRRHTPEQAPGQGRRAARADRDAGDFGEASGVRGVRGVRGSVPAGAGNLNGHPPGCRCLECGHLAGCRCLSCKQPELRGAAAVPKTVPAVGPCGHRAAAHGARAGPPAVQVHASSRFVEQAFSAWRRVSKPTAIGRDGGWPEPPGHVGRQDTVGFDDNLRSLGHEGGVHSGGGTDTDSGSEVGVDSGSDGEDGASGHAWREAVGVRTSTTHGAHESDERGAQTARSTARRKRASRLPVPAGRTPRHAATVLQTSPGGVSADELETFGKVTLAHALAPPPTTTTTTTTTTHTVTCTHTGACQCPRGPCPAHLAGEAALVSRGRASVLSRCHVRICTCVCPVLSVHAAKHRFARNSPCLKPGIQTTTLTTAASDLRSSR